MEDVATGKDQRSGEHGDQHDVGRERGHEFLAARFDARDSQASSEVREQYLETRRRDSMDGQRSLHADAVVREGLRAEQVPDEETVGLAAQQTYETLQPAEAAKAE